VAPSGNQLSFAPWLKPLITPLELLTKVLFLSLWPGALFSLLSGTSGHRRTFVRSEWPQKFK